MRGSRLFKKIVERTPSGSYRWQIVDRFGECVATGRSPQWQLARDHATARERQMRDKIPSLGRGKKSMERRILERLPKDGSKF